MNDRIIQALKVLKDNQDEINKFKKDLENKLIDLKNNSNKSNEDIKKEVSSLESKLQKIIESQSKKDDFNLQKLMISLSAELERWNIINGEWCYNGKPVGVRAEAKDGKDGKPGKDGKDGKPGNPGPKGEDGETPNIKIGKVETSDEYGGAKAKFRKVKGKNEYLLDLVLPRGPQGFHGFDATINGKSSIEILAGNNISVTQEGKKVFINSLVNPFELKVVKELPIENISSSAMYFSPSPDPEEKDVFIESIYINKGTEEEPNWDWEYIGKTKVDLTGYISKDETTERGIIITKEDGNTETVKLVVYK